MKTKKQIIEWLKSNGLYEAFAKNIHPVTVEEIAEQYIREVHCSLSIFTSFSWHNTDEAQDGGYFKVGDWDRQVLHTCRQITLHLQEVDSLPPVFINFLIKGEL